MFNQNVLDVLETLKQEQIILTKKQNKRLRKILNSIESNTIKIDELSQLINPTYIEEDPSAKKTRIQKIQDALDHQAGELINEPYVKAD